MRRWGSQWDRVRLGDDPCDADVRRLHTALGESCRRRAAVSIVHGDYRIDNTDAGWSSMPSEDELAQRYSNASGQPLAH